MAIVVTLPEVQQWLEETKLQITAVDPTLEDTYQDILFAKLSNLYDTSGWVDVPTTPSLVRKILSMYIAARLYKRAYSENSFNNEDNYGTELENAADKLVEGIIAGNLELPDPVVSLQEEGPAFWPTDQTAILEPRRGLIVGSGSAAKFEMGQYF